MAVEDHFPSRHLRIPSSRHLRCLFPSAAMVSRALRDTVSILRSPPPLNPWRPARSISTSHTSRSPFGIVFDIDGVLLRGGQPIEGAPEALRQLFHDVSNPSYARIPFVFLTNGGGVRESVKASELSSLLGVKIVPEQVLLGHTPFRSLVDRFYSAPVLAVGKGELATVMVEYGCRNAVSMEEYVSQFKDIDPLAKYKHWSSVEVGDRKGVAQMNHMLPKQIDAVFIVSDPVDWGRDIQVLCDVLRSGGFPGRGSGQQPPIFLAADDFEYQAAFPVERLGMGAFRIALEHIYNRIGDSPLRYTSFGKPKVSVFRNAKLALQQRVADTLPPSLRLARQDDNSLTTDSQDPQEKLVDFESIYMIGDNPATDILGARQAGRPWFSILTRTGCFKGKDNDALYPADLVVQDVQEAIQFILKKHGLDVQ